MKFLLRAISLFVLTIGLGGCLASSPSKRFDPRKVEINSTPKANYLIAVTFENIDPTEFSTSASARYRVSNRDCVAVDPGAAIGGLQLLPEYQQALPVSLTEDGKHTISLSLDALRPEDYFGLGVCKWELDGLSFRFSNANAQFVTGLGAEEVTALISKVQYFLLSDLSRTQGRDWVFGEGPNFYLAKLGPQFTTTLRATLATQTLGEIK